MYRTRRDSFAAPMAQRASPRLAVSLNKNPFVLGRNKDFAQQNVERKGRQADIGSQMQKS